MLLELHPANILTVVNYSLDWTLQDGQVLGVGRLHVSRGPPRFTSQMKTYTLSDASESSLPISLTFSRIGASHSNIFQCNVNWFKDTGNPCRKDDDPRNSHRDKQARSFRSRWYEEFRNQLRSTPGAILDTQSGVPIMERSKDNSKKVLLESLQHSASPSRVHSISERTADPGHDLMCRFFSQSAPRIPNHRIRQKTKELLPPIRLSPPICSSNLTDKGGSSECSFVRPDLCSASSSGDQNHQSHSSPSCQNTAEAFDSAPLWYKQLSCDMEKPSRQRSLHRTSESRKLRREAEQGMLRAQQNIGLDDKAHAHFRCSPEYGRTPSVHPLTPPHRPRLWIKGSSSEESVEQAHVTTVMSPSKARLITISPRTPSSKTSSPADRPALVSAFSPDTPSETPHVTNRTRRNNEVNDILTSPPGNEYVAGSLDTTINNPVTPPSSLVPTPCNEAGPSACLRRHSRWVQSTMTQLDSLTAWILQELEVVLADFPRTTLRLNSPVIEGIRSTISTSAIPERTTRNRSSTAPHSRYSLFKPVTTKIVGTQSPIERDPTPQSHPALRNAHPNPAALALRAVFPNARPHHLDSLHATYIALHYTINLPSLKLTATPASDAAASPDTASPKHSRSSSVASSIPAKARAMLGLDSPIPLSPSSSSPSPAKSWFRVSTPELDPEVKMRLENVEILLESSIRKILVEIEGRPLGKQDDALVRAVGELIKLGENRSQ